MNEMAGDGRRGEKRGREGRACEEGTSPKVSYNRLVCFVGIVRVREGGKESLGEVRRRRE